MIGRGRLLIQSMFSEYLTHLQFNPAIYSALERAKGKLDEKQSYEFKFVLIYDNRLSREKKGRIHDHSKPLHDMIKPSLEEYFGFNVSLSLLIPNQPEVMKLVVERKAGGSEFSDVEKILDILTDSNHYHHCTQSILSVKKTGGETVEFVVSGEPNRLYQWVERTPVTVHPIPLVPYEDRTTVTEPEDREEIKSHVERYFYHSIIPQILLRDADGALIGFERVSLAGRQRHVAWRMSLESVQKDLFDICSIADIKTFYKLIREDNAINFYPALSKHVLTDRIEIHKLRHKLVREYDRPAVMPQDLAARVSDICNRTIVGDFGIPAVYAHSGSNSARNQIIIDTDPLIEQCHEIYERFPVLSCVRKGEKFRTVRDVYSTILKGLDFVTNIRIMENLEEEGLLFTQMGERTYTDLYGTIRKIKKPVPTVTFSRETPFRPVSLLVDTPYMCSIGIGSPKSKRRITEEDRERLPQIHPEFKDFTGKYYLLACLPIERCPRSQDEIVAGQNMFSARDYFFYHSNSVIRGLKQRLTPEKIIEIFEQILDQEGKRRFMDFCKHHGSEERKYLERHHRFSHISPT